MKNLFLLAAALFLGIATANAQDIKFGAKIGANFSKLDGGNIDGNNLTSFHVGALAEINLLQNFSVQPEIMYSSQGTDYMNEDLKLDYISVPVLARFYVITDKLSLDAGPQFSFLINESVKDQFDAKTFDFAAAGGLTYNLTSFVFVQARYVVGLTDVSKDASVTNKVFQLSAGLRF